MSDDEWDVTLDWMDVAMAAFAGMLREIRNRQANNQHKWNASIANGWTRDIESSCAEKVVAKKFGVYWFDGRKNETDAGRFQVRHTPLIDGRLTLHPEDSDDEEFVLVRGTAPKFRLAGWCFGREGKKDAYWEDPTGQGRWAFFVPNSVLHPMSELKK